MDRAEAFRVVAKHIYVARMWFDGDRTLIILADNIEEAKDKAQKVLGVLTVPVKRVEPTDDPQVYEL